MSSLKLWLFVVALFFSVSCCISEVDPTEIVDRALECFNKDYIYRRCDEAYRLSDKGHLDVPREKTDAFCEGPCLAETRLVLRCINNILNHFTFYNRATIRDIRHTLKAGCSYSQDRGNFKVEDYMYQDKSYKDNYQDYYYKDNGDNGGDNSDGQSYFNHYYDFSGAGAHKPIQPGYSRSYSYVANLVLGFGLPFFI
ncbi:PREDICTED: uncharacterized protein LOC104598822 [Nelumbo nucifera]|uniref:Uncharacterized protein LOC104598822 n=2 Tax=Nelumbo nucifera TaxID=4432 RepID=A0A1U8A3I2_NELNU|nr:PREDICTED: uncharacterized protein LOC104598822 [Nelumbo nucifera]DAD38215.1 TPA_asm: hypothetical protein HUJ06_008856 [Nelumbo nucifera]